MTGARKSLMWSVTVCVRQNDTSSQIFFFLKQIIIFKKVMTNNERLVFQKKIATWPSKFIFCQDRIEQDMIIF